ncbi:MAG: hypothetical protein IJ906_03540 [Oscillospiraceae bacterium]|nr:hypothetical protein [Oscillospiraceae bacterium]
MLTEPQIRAVRWYIGDVEGDDPFWGDPKAYVTVNALFFPGLETERVRAAEGKRLNPAILEDAHRLCRTLEMLMSAFRPLAAPVRTFRVERYSDYTSIKENGSRTCSFTSTSTAGFLWAYQDRTGIALMQFELPAGTPCIDMRTALDHYAKPDEAEILLPPGLSLTLTAHPLTAEEKQILDADGDPPMISVTAVPDGRRPAPAPEEAVPDAYRLAGIRVLRAITAGEEPDAEDVRMYALWKHALTQPLSDPWKFLGEA